MSKLTPAMQQFVDLKKQNPDAVLFFRLGDFYETFWEDAKICNKVLDLVLTCKNKNSENPIPMAGIPHHSAEKYINKLIQKGYKVAIAEQMTDPIPWKVVEREVVRVITPATYIQEQDHNFNFLLSICSVQQKNGEHYHIARWDFSIGEYHSKSFEDIEALQKFIFRIQPKEIIIDIDFPNKETIQNSIKNFSDTLISIYDQPFAVEEYLLQQCKVQTLSSYWSALEEGRANAFALLLNYIKNTQRTNINNIVKISFHSNDDKIIFDDTSIKNLEIFSSSYESNEKYSLFGVINTTKTAWWSRLLREILANPSKNLSLIKERLNKIEYFRESNKYQATEHIHHLLGGISDIHKLTSKILYNKLNPVIFVKLRSLLRTIIQDKTTNEELQKLGINEQDWGKLATLLEKLTTTFKDDELIKQESDYINDGVDARIDELRAIAYHSDDLLLSYQQEITNRTGISGIKLRFVSNQWYFIEITNKDIELFETKVIREDEKFDFIRRQTLKSCQRYLSPYLEEIQVKILTARDELVKKEAEYLENMKKDIEENIRELSIFGNTLAWLDVYTAFAIFAQDRQLTKPEIHAWNEITIQWGRHLVIEKFLENNEKFIVNNLEIGSDWLIHIITGPNMWGKSTFLRQNALIVLMAHCGLFVPCENAKIGIVDGIFARVGSGDIIAKNQSTFMTEMIEVVNILNNASEKSFIIFDELGRGTSTYDGLALTKAILEYISVKLQAKTLIATHYHELIQLENNYQNIKNFSVSVYETNKEVIFMKKIVAGGADKSYWIDVAQLAGLPDTILQQARKNLEALQTPPQEYKKEEKGREWGGLFTPTPLTSTPHPEYEKIKSILSNFDINTITPLQALQLLDKLKGEL